MEIEILHFIHVWYEIKEFARVIDSSRHLSRYAEGPMAQSYIHFRRVRKTKHEYVGKAQRKMQGLCRRLDRTELRTDHCLHIAELPDSPDSGVFASSNEPDSDDFDYGALMDRNDLRAQMSQTGSSTATHSRTCGSWPQNPESIMAKSLATQGGRQVLGP